MRDPDRLRVGPGDDERHTHAAETPRVPPYPPEPTNPRVTTAMTWNRTAQGIALCALTAGLWAGTPALGADDAKDAAKQLLNLTGDRRVKVVWNQGAEKDKKKTLRYLDTKDAVVLDLPFAGSAPLLTQDGLKVLASTGDAPDRSVMVYDTEKKVATKLCTGPGNNLLAVWQDPKTKRDWVYVNDAGDKNEKWDAPAGKVFRFPLDKPEARELFWDRTSSHIYLMFSADGTRACFEPSWSNIGQLSLATDDQGKVDQDKSKYKSFGGGCFPSLAPDNSYRLFRLDGDHRSITLADADNANPRKVDVVGMLAGEKKKRSSWLTRWSTHPRYLTLVAPAGKDADIWMGRFDEKFTKVEAWVKVSGDMGPQCWQSHAWIDPKN
jgi:hypothetical protein